MSSLLLRSISPEDETFLYKLYASVRQEEVTAWGWAPEQADVFLHMQWVAQRSSYAMQFPYAVHCIISQDQESVGQCYVDYTEANLRLIDISIMPNCRNRGIGSVIIKNLQQEARQRCVPMLLSVTPENPAHRLYERLGFIITGVTDMYVSMQWLPPNTIRNGEGKADE